MCRKHRGVVLLLGIALAACEQDPTAVEPLEAHVTPASTGTTETEALREHIQALRRILARPTARFGGSGSNGRPLTPAAVISTLEAHLARLSSPPPSGSRSTLSARGSLAAASMSGRLSGWTFGSTNNYGSMSETTITAYTEGYGSDYLQSETSGEVYGWESISNRPIAQ